MLNALQECYGALQIFRQDLFHCRFEGQNTESFAPNVPGPICSFGARILTIYFGSFFFCELSAEGINPPDYDAAPFILTLWEGKCHLYHQARYGNFPGHGSNRRQKVFGLRLLTDTGIWIRSTFPIQFPICQHELPGISYREKLVSTRMMNLRAWFLGCIALHALCLALFSLAFFKFLFE